MSLENSYWRGREGVGRADSLVDAALFEHSMREIMNRSARRRMAVLDPLKLVIDSWQEGRVEEVEALDNPNDPAAGRRSVPFSRELFVERADFMEDPPRGFRRLAPGREVRLRFACLVTCTEAVRNAAGEIVALRCTHDPASRGGAAPDGRKVRGAIHWVSARESVAAEVRLYDRLFAVPDPGADGDFIDDLNPSSLTVLAGARLEPALDGAPPGVAVQFERQGYFAPDPESRPGRPVFNRIVGLRDGWAKAGARTAR